jgi:hypothetical protein
VRVTWNWAGAGDELDQRPTTRPTIRRNRSSARRAASPRLERSTVTERDATTQDRSHDDV